MYNYKQPVAMKVTQKQFEKDLKQPLLKLGYDVYSCKNSTIYPCIVNNAYNTVGTVDNYPYESIKKYNRYPIEEYNPELYLALAAMTEGEDWIVGEWLVSKETEELFKVKELSGADYMLGKVGYEYKNLYRKATKEELIEHFKVVTTKNAAVIREDISTNDRFPFTLSEVNAKRIINMACPEWQKILIENWATDLLTTNEVIIQESFYNQMRKACTDRQNTLFDVIFGKDIEHIPDGTPCLVRYADRCEWLLRYANGNGKFYHNGGKQGKGLDWKYVHVIKELGDLPE